MATVGGIRDVEGSQNSLEMDSLARFAVDEHNKKEALSTCCIELKLVGDQFPIGWHDYRYIFPPELHAQGPPMQGMNVECKCNPLKKSQSIEEVAT